MCVERLPSLRPAEQRVAQAVLADPAGISESSITAVARMCQTSETTVLRFCRAIGLAGYPELRIALARAAQFEETDHGDGPPLNGDDQRHRRTGRRGGQDHPCRRPGHRGHRRHPGPERRCRRPIDAVASASRIDIYGVGASGLVGQVLHQKLHRIGLVSFVATEAPAGADLGRACSGRATSPWASPTPGHHGDTVDALQVARRAGGHDDRGHQLRPVADRRRGRPDPDHRRAGDDVPVRVDVQPDRPARGGRLPVRRGGPARVRRLDR